MISKFTIAERAVKSIQFLENIKGRTFTTQDLADATEMKIRHARDMLNVLSLYYPISIVKEATNFGFGKGKKFALYRMEKF